MNDFDIAIGMDEDYEERKPVLLEEGEYVGKAFKIDPYFPKSMVNEIKGSNDEYVMRGLILTTKVENKSIRDWIFWYAVDPETGKLKAHAMAYKLAQLLKACGFVVGRNTEGFSTVPYINKQGETKHKLKMSFGSNLELLERFKSIVLEKEYTVDVIVSEDGKFNNIKKYKAIEEVTAPMEGVPAETETTKEAKVEESLDEADI